MSEIEVKIKVCHHTLKLYKEGIITADELAQMPICYECLNYIRMVEKERRFIHIKYKKRHANYRDQIIINSCKYCSHCKQFEFSWYCDIIGFVNWNGVCDEFKT